MYQLKESAPDVIQSPHAIVLEHVWNKSLVALVGVELKLTVRQQKQTVYVKKYTINVKSDTDKA